jgi:hypothetical protein
MQNAKYVPTGWPVLIPRIAVDDPESLVGFLQHVFGATGELNPDRPAELRIGDSLLMVGSTIASRCPLSSTSTSRTRMPFFGARSIMVPYRSKILRTCHTEIVVP